MDSEALSGDDLDAALTLQEDTGLRLGQVLSVAGLVPPRAITEAIAEQFALPVVEPDPYKVPLVLLQRFPEARLTRSVCFLST